MVDIAERLLISCQGNLDMPSSTWVIAAGESSGLMDSLDCWDYTILTAAAELRPSAACDMAQSWPKKGN